MQPTIHCLAPCLRRCAQMQTSNLSRWMAILSSPATPLVWRPSLCGTSTSPSRPVSPHPPQLWFLPASPLEHQPHRRQLPASFHRHLLPRDPATHPLSPPRPPPHTSLLFDPPFLLRFFLQTSPQCSLRASRQFSRRANLRATLARNLQVNRRHGQVRNPRLSLRTSRQDSHQVDRLLNRQVSRLASRPPAPLFPRVPLPLSRLGYLRPGLSEHPPRHPRPNPPHVRRYSPPRTLLDSHRASQLVNPLTTRPANQLCNRALVQQERRRTNHPCNPQDNHRRNHQTSLLANLAVSLQVSLQDSHLHNQLDSHRYSPRPSQRATRLHDPLLPLDSQRVNHHHNHRTSPLGSPRDILLPSPRHSHHRNLPVSPVDLLSVPYTWISKCCCSLTALLILLQRLLAPRQRNRSVSKILCCLLYDYLSVSADYVTPVLASVIPFFFILLLCCCAKQISFWCFDTYGYARGCLCACRLFYGKAYIEEGKIENAFYNFRVKPVL